MPPPVGMGLGDAPPSAPRVLPKGFAFRQKWSHNLGTLAGGILFLVSSLVFVGFVNARSWGALAPLFFMLLSAAMFIHGRRSAVAVLNAFRYGVAAEGKVDSLQLDTTQSINQKHPWVMTYHFPVGGSLVEGKLTSYNSTLGKRSVGQPLWVLYLESDPTQSTIYPPLK